MVTEEEHLGSMTFQEQQQHMDSHLADFFKLGVEARRQRLPPINHAFSHIKQLVLAEFVQVPAASPVPEGMRLVSAEEVGSTAISKTTALLMESTKKIKSQPSVASFFAKKPKK